MWLKIDDNKLINLDLVKAIDKGFNDMIIIRYELDQDVINFRNEWTRDAAFDDIQKYIKSGPLMTDIKTGNDEKEDLSSI